MIEMVMTEATMMEMVLMKTILMEMVVMIMVTGSLQKKKKKINRHSPTSR